MIRFFSSKIIFNVILLAGVIGEKALAQYKSPKILAEITSKLAKYDYDEHRYIIGPSSIDIDQNGNIYVASGFHVLVFSNKGNHLRTIVFDKEFDKIIQDIALGRDGRLYILAWKYLYCVNKDLTEITRNNVERGYFFHTSTALRRIWVAADNKCLIGMTEFEFFVLDEAVVKKHDQSTNFYGFPFFEVTPQKSRTGAPLKWGHSVYAVSEDRQSIYLPPTSIFNSDTGKTETSSQSIKRSQSTVMAKELIPLPQRKLYSQVCVEEIIATENYPNLFVSLSVKHDQSSALRPNTAKNFPNRIFGVMTKSGSHAGLIDSIPGDLISNIFLRGKRYTIGSDGRLYGLYTVGDESNLGSCVTRIIRW